MPAKRIGTRIKTTPNLSGQVQCEGCGERLKRKGNLTPMQHLHEHYQFCYDFKALQTKKIADEKQVKRDYALAADDARRDALELVDLTYDQACAIVEIMKEMILGDDIPF